MFLKNTELFDLFSSLSHDQLCDYKFLQDIIENKIGMRLNLKTMNMPDYYFKFRGGLMMKQYPHEVAKLLSFLYSIKEEINSYVEIGVERGGTFFTVDSFMRAVNPNFHNGIAVDLSNKIIRHDFQEYETMHPGCSFQQTNSTSLVLEDVDFCFIDGDHSYAGVKLDFEKMKEKSKYIALHDIKCSLPYIEISKLWEEIHNDYENWEFVLQDKDFPVMLGIGVIKLR